MTLSLWLELVLAWPKAIVSFTCLRINLSSGHQSSITHLLTFAWYWSLVFWAVWPVRSISLVAYITDIMLTLVRSFCLFRRDRGRLIFEFCLLRYLCLFDCWTRTCWLFALACPHLFRLGSWLLCVCTLGVLLGQRWSYSGRSDSRIWYRLFYFLQSLFTAGYKRLALLFSWWSG